MQQSGARSTDVAYGGHSREQLRQLAQGSQQAPCQQEQESGTAARAAGPSSCDQPCYAC